MDPREMGGEGEVIIYVFRAKGGGASFRLFNKTYQSKLAKGGYSPVANPWFMLVKQNMLTQDAKGMQASSVLHMTQLEAISQQLYSGTL